MNQREISLDFLNKLNDENYKEFYKFFTKESTAYLISLDQEVSVEEALNYLKGEIVNSLELVRVLESKMFVKLETTSSNNKINLFFEIKSRRIRRLEIEIIK